MQRRDVPVQLVAARAAGAQQLLGDVDHAPLVDPEQLASAARREFSGDGARFARAKDKRVGHGFIPLWMSESACRRAVRVGGLCGGKRATTARLGVGAMPLRPEFGEWTPRDGGDSQLNPFAASAAVDDHAHCAAAAIEFEGQVCLRVIAAGQRVLDSRRMFLDANLVIRVFLRGCRRLHGVPLTNARTFAHNLFNSQVH